MRVVGTLSQDGDEFKGKVFKGGQFPEHAQEGDLFTLVQEGPDQVYIRKDNVWIKLVLDGDYIDAGSF